MVDRIVAVGDDFDLPPQTKNRLARNHSLFVVDQSLGDGTTDATAEIQSKISQAHTAGGGTVLIPAGIYRKGAALVVPSGVTVTGVGSATVVRNLPGANAPVFTTNQGTERIAIRDLVADGLNDGSHTVPFSAIYLNGCSSSLFTGLETTGGVRLYGWPHPQAGRGNGIEIISGSNQNRVSDIYTHDTPYDGIQFGSSEYNVLSNIRAHNCGKGGVQLTGWIHGTATEFAASRYNNITGLTVTHDTGVPSTPHSPHTNVLTFHSAQFNMFSAVVGRGTEWGLDAAEDGIPNTGNAVHGANLRIRGTMNVWPEVYSNITIGPYDETLPSVTYASGSGSRRLIVDSRGLVYDHNGAQTVIGP